MASSTIAVTAIPKVANARTIPKQHRRFIIQHSPHSSQYLHKKPPREHIDEKHGTMAHVAKLNKGHSSNFCGGQPSTSRKHMAMIA